MQVFRASQHLHHADGSYYATTLPWVCWFQRNWLYFSNMPILGLSIFAMILLLGPLWNKDCIDFMGGKKKIPLNNRSQQFSNMNNSEYEKKSIVSWLVRTKSRNTVIQAYTVYRNSVCVWFHYKTATKYIHIHKFIIISFNTYHAMCFLFKKSLPDTSIIGILK